MMIKGSLYITNDFNVTLSSMIRSKVIVIGERNDQLEGLGAIGGELFLPPYNASMAELNGDNMGFARIYTDYLMQPEPQKFIAAIVKALLNGVNILFYLTKDESEMTYSKILCQTLTNYYGILVGTPECPFNYDMRYDQAILSLLYLHELIIVPELMELYPNEVHFTLPVVSKLLVEFPPAIQVEEDFINMEKYYYEYKEFTRMQGKFLMPLLSHEE